MTKIRDRDQLLDAAAKVFAEKGFESARLEDIAAELGVLQGSLYYHVASKAELLLLVQRRRFRWITARLQEIAASELPPRAKLDMAVREHLRHIAEHHPESAEWFKEPSQSRTSEEDYNRWRREHRAYVEIFEEIMGQCVEAGELRADLDLRIAARGLIGMCDWLPRWYQKDGRLSIDEITDIFLAMVLDGMACRPR